MAHEEEPMKVQEFDRSCWTAGSPCWSDLLLKDCTPWEQHMLEQSLKECLMWVGTHTGTGKEHEEESVAEVKHYQLVTTPIPHLLAPIRGRGWGIQGQSLVSEEGG